MRLFVPDHDALKQPHRYHKRKSLNCGDPKCIVCMNPRKAFGEKTMQEIKFECQAIVDEKKDPIGQWEWEDLNDPNIDWNGGGSDYIYLHDMDLQQRTPH